MLMDIFGLLLALEGCVRKRDTFSRKKTYELRFLGDRVVPNGTATAVTMEQYKPKKNATKYIFELTAK